LKLAPLHAPADTNGEGTRDAVTHLLAYGVKPAKGTSPFQKRRDVRVVNPCSDTFVQLKKPVGLLVPTAKSLTDPVTSPDPGTHERDHFLCYAAAAQSKRIDGTPLPKLPKGMQVDVADQFQTRRYDLKTITRLCQPVAKSGAPVLLSGRTRAHPSRSSPRQSATRSSFWSATRRNSPPNTSRRAAAVRQARRTRARRSCPSRRSTRPGAASTSRISSARCGSTPRKRSSCASRRRARTRGCRRTRLAP